MIALYLNWYGQGAHPDVARRLVASLSSGTGAAVGQFDFGHGLIVATCANKAEARRWFPATTPRGEHVVVTGFFYHKAELSRSLGVEPRSDAELYAAGYAAWGEEVDVRMLGEFASIVVTPHERRVRIARSPIKAPPLHVRNDAERLIVASTARVIFASGEIAQEVDEQKVADSLLLNYHEEERSWFKGVSRLRSNSRAVLTPAKQSLEQYYSPHDAADVRLKHDADYVEAANALLIQGTDAALEGFSRPAISVSGGFDSQAVAAHVAKLLPTGARLLALTAVPEPGWDGIVPDNRFGDEHHHVLALARQYPNIDTATVDAAGLSFAHKLPALFMMAGAPPRNAINLHWIHEVNALAKARNCDVVFNAEMGNATFSFAGEGYLPSLLAQGRWITLCREIGAGKGRRSFVRTLLSQSILPFVPGEVYKYLIRLYFGDNGDPFSSWCPLNADYARDMHLSERATELGYDTLYRSFRSTRAWRTEVLGNAMSESGDIVQGIEQIHQIPSRDPTAYRPLVEFCFGIPDDQYLRNGQKRWLARRMLRGVVPDMVLNEKRRGLQAADWHLRLGRERDFLLAELKRLGEDPAMARRLDLQRLSKALVEWPATTPMEARRVGHLLQLAIPRALTTARFINYVEGKN